MKRYTVIFMLYTAIIVVGSEIVLRLLVGDPNYYWDKRYLFISTPGFRQVNDKLWTYHPDTLMRSLAVYGTSPRTGDMRMEYDCQFSTDEFGLVSTGKKIDPQRKTILVLGDSFLEGQGGCNWLDKIAGEFPNFNIVNGGLQGNGVIGFQAVHDFLVGRGLQIDIVIVVAISNDFWRVADANWVKRDAACLTQGRCRDEYWYGVPIRATEPELLEAAARRAYRRHRQSGNWVTDTMMLVYFNSRLAQIFNFVRTRFSAPTEGTSSSDQLFKENLRSLEALISQHPGLEILLVSQRDEAAIHSKNANSVIVSEHLRKHDLNFRWCELVHSHYLRHDGHPNAKGYAKVAQCLSQVIKNLVATNGNENIQQASAPLIK